MADPMLAVTEALIKQRKLGTRDAVLSRATQLSPQERLADERGNQTPANLMELQQEITQTTNPAARKVLEDELQRITSGGLLGPRPVAPMPVSTLGVRG